MIYNTGETDESLRQEYNPEGSQMRKMQYRLLDMLLYLDGICKKLGVQYYLDGGTCLGAVRHGGFIPWDDDLDVVIDVKDFNRLCNYLLEHPHPQYVLHNRKTDENYYVGWARLRDTFSESKYQGNNSFTANQENIFKYTGLMIDLFPYSDHVIPWVHKPLHWVQNRILRKYFVGKHKLLADLMYHFLFDVIKPIANFIGIVFSHRKFYAHDYLSHDAVYRFPKNKIYPLRDIKFEGHTFHVPNDTDYYLRYIYNNYMGLPPKSVRRHHSLAFSFLD